MEHDRQTRGKGGRKGYEGERMGERGGKGRRISRDSNKCGEIEEEGRDGRKK